MASSGTEALARDVIAEPGTGLGAQLDHFAGGLRDRYLGFGLGRAPTEASLVSRVFERWQSLGQGAHDLSVFDEGALAGLVRDWGASAPGYFGTDFADGAGPFVIPVDPVAHAGGMPADQAGQRRPRSSLIPQVRRGAPPAPRPQAAETWRAVEGSAAAPLSPYPAALGRAGAIQPSLLRFPDARAEVRRPAAGGAAARRALITSAHPGQSWGPAGAALTPAAAGAEALSEALHTQDRFTETRSADLWLLDARQPAPARAGFAAAQSSRPGRLGHPGRIGLRAEARATDAAELAGPARAAGLGRVMDLGALVAPIAGPAEAPPRVAGPAAGSPQERRLDPAVARAPQAAAARPGARGPAAGASPVSPGAAATDPLGSPRAGGLQAIPPAAESVFVGGRSPEGAPGLDPAPTGGRPSVVSAPGARLGAPFLPKSLRRLLTGPTLEVAREAQVSAPWQRAGSPEAPGALVRPAAALQEAAAGPAVGEAAPARRPGLAARLEPQGLIGRPPPQGAAVPPAAGILPGATTATPPRGFVAGAPTPVASRPAGPRAGQPAATGLGRALARGEAAVPAWAWAPPGSAPLAPRAAARAVASLLARLTAGAGAVPPAPIQRLLARFASSAEGRTDAPGAPTWDDAPGALVLAAQGVAELEGRPDSTAQGTRSAAGGRPGAPGSVPSPGAAELSPVSASVGAAAPMGRGLAGPGRPAIGVREPLSLLLGAGADGDAGLGGLLAGSLGRADALLARLGQTAWGPMAADPGVAAALLGRPAGSTSLADGFGPDGAPGALVTSAVRAAEVLPGASHGVTRQGADRGGAAGPLARAADPLRPGLATPVGPTPVGATPVGSLAGRAQSPAGAGEGPGLAVGIGALPEPRLRGRGLGARRLGPAIGRAGAGAQRFGSQRLGLRGTERAPSRRFDGLRETPGILLSPPLRTPTEALPGATGERVSGLRPMSARIPGLQPAGAGTQRPIPGRLPQGVARALAVFDAPERVPPGAGALAQGSLAGWTAAEPGEPGSPVWSPWAVAAGLQGAAGDLVAPWSRPAPSASPAGEGGVGSEPAAAPVSGRTSARRAVPLPGAAGIRALGFGEGRARLDDRLFGPASVAAVGGSALAGPAGALVQGAGPQRGARPSAGAESAPRDRSPEAWLPAPARQALAEAAALAAGAARAPRGRPAGLPGAVIRPGGASAPAGLSARPSARSMGGARRQPLQPANLDRALVAFGQAQRQAGAPGAGMSDSPAARLPASAPAGSVLGAVGELFAPPPAEVAAPASIGRPAAPRPRPSLQLPGSLFADRGPSVSLGAPAAAPRRVMVDTSRSTAAEALRSTPGQRPQRKAETAEEARHRNADQSEDALSPEEVERIAHDVITMLEREAEFDLDRLGEDFD